MNMKSKRLGKDTSRAEPLGTAIEITEKHLAVTLQDGRVIITPLEWYPRLYRASPADRSPHPPNT